MGGSRSQPGKSLLQLTVVASSVADKVLRRIVSASYFRIMSCMRLDSGRSLMPLLIDTLTRYLDTSHAPADLKNALVSVAAEFDQWNGSDAVPKLTPLLRSVRRLLKVPDARRDQAAG